MGRKPMFREVVNIDLGGKLSPSSVWSLERRALRHYRPARSLWNIPGLAELDHHKHNYIIGVYPSADGGLTAAVGSNGTVRVHEPGDVDDSYRVELKLPDSIAATWGISDQLYMALAYQAKIWRFDLESCETNKPSYQLVLPEHDRRSSAPRLSDISFLGPHLLAVTMSNSMMYVLDDRLKRSAVSAARVSGGNGSVKPPALTSSNPCIVTAARGCISVFDIRRLPPATYGNVLSHMRTLGGGGISKPATSNGLVTSIRATQSPSDFGSIHIAPGSRTTVAFQLSSGHVGVCDLVGSGNAKVKIEPAVPQCTTTTGETDLVDYGATYNRAQMNTWWVERRRCSIATAPYGTGWRFYAPLVHETGFRIVAMHTNAPSRVLTVKTAEKVTSICALSQYGGCPSLAVGYSRLGVDLFHSELSRGNCVEDNSL